MTRVYVATTLDGLAGFLAAGEVPATATDRFAADGPAEEDEYLALMSAADACPDQRRRVVVVAERDGDADDAVPWRDVVAVHADPAERPADADDDDLAWYAVQEVEPLLIPRC